MVAASAALWQLKMLTSHTLQTSMTELATKLSVMCSYLEDI